jgi:formylglycine-generating enzyme required for sulfatase activity
VAFAGPEEFVNSVGIKMVKIGPGSFEMGSTLGRDYWDEQPVHKVCWYGRPFALRSGC